MIYIVKTVSEKYIKMIIPFFLIISFSGYDTDCTFLYHYVYI